MDSESGSGIVLLQENQNWDVWKFQVRMVLQDKDLMGVVTNGVVEPDGGKEKESPDLVKKDFFA